MPVTNIAAYILSVLSSNKDAPPEWGHARRYLGSARISACVRQNWKHNIKSVVYEILPRAAGDAAVKSYTLESYYSHLAFRSGGVENLSTPEEIRVRLLNTKFRHSYTPNWERFDFGGMVYRLASWLAYATWKPKTTLADMSKGKNMVLLGMNNPEETFGLNDNRVYISQAVTASSQAATFWALAWAAAGSGSTVLTDHVVLTTDYASRVKDFAGGKAWYGAIEALAILAEYYNQAGAGDTFAVMFFAGLHAVNSVVGHSDEGGLVRDVWRKVRVAECFGGLPRECVRSNSMPSIAVNTSYRALTTWVDAYTLLSAAAVAHCDPLCEVGDGQMFPTVLDSCGAAPGDSRISQLAGSLEQSFGRFLRHYIKALTTLVGGEALDQFGRADSILGTAASELFVTGCSRHLDYDVVAPYFWIEPTGLLESNMFGTPAEVEGWASYGAGREVKRLGFFERMARVGTHSDFKSEWVTQFKGARRCGAVLFLQGMPQDGLAFLTPIQFDSGSVCLTAAVGGEAHALRTGQPINHYLWARGQSSFPHPAEMLNIANTMMWRICHYSADASGVVYSKNVPLSDELDRIELVMTFNRLEQVGDEAPNRATATLRRERKIATAALNHASEIMAVCSGRTLVDNSVMDVAPVFPSKAGGTDERQHDGAPGKYDAIACSNRLQASTDKDKRGATVTPTLQHESLRAPQLARADTRPQGVAITGPQDGDGSGDNAGTVNATLGDTTLYTATSTGAINQAGAAPIAGGAPAATQ